MAKDLKRERDSRKGAEQHQRPSDCAPLILGQAVSQQQSNAGAKGGTGAGNQG